MQCALKGSLPAGQESEVVSSKVFVQIRWVGQVRHCHN